MAGFMRLMRYSQWSTIGVTAVDDKHDPYDVAACIEGAALRGADIGYIHTFTDLLEEALGRERDGSLRSAVEKAVAEYQGGNQMRGSLILATILALFAPPLAKADEAF